MTGTRPAPGSLQFSAMAEISSCVTVSVLCVCSMLWHCKEDDFIFCCKEVEILTSWTYGRRVFSDCQKSRKCKLGGEGRPRACSMFKKKLFVLSVMAIFFSCNCPVQKFNLPTVDRVRTMSATSLLTWPVFQEQKKSVSIMWFGSLLHLFFCLCFYLCPGQFLNSSTL